MGVILGGSVVLAAQTASEPLAWDALTKEQTLRAGELTAHFTFGVTNTSAAEVVVEKVTASCGCTAVKLPATPWRLAPGTGGQLQFSTDLRGKHGTLSKTATVQTSVGVRVLTMTVSVPAPPQGEPGTAPALGDRARNQALARADHQAVFRGDCARCHAEPAKGRQGRELYGAVCGICHEAEHRADMVPELGRSEQAGNAAYWRTWITFGKPGSLMPAFARGQGGPLDAGQIESLATYLATQHRGPAGRMPRLP